MLRLVKGLFSRPIFTSRMKTADMDNKSRYIDKIIGEEVKNFSKQFLADYKKTGKKADNIINKKNNIFIEALGDKVVAQSALMRSLDSSLGNRIEKIAMRIAEKNYIVKKEVDGYISQKSTDAIARLLESYKSRSRSPKTDDVEKIDKEDKKGRKEKRHFTDYYLVPREDSSKKYLVELKIGGDLDNKKARSEKEALLEQYVILRSSKEIDPKDEVKIFFCTAYNKDGEGKYWKQERVRQFFADSEIKVGKDFWNFVANSPDGYKTVKKSYLKHAHYLKDALQKIVDRYA